MSPRNGLKLYHSQNYSVVVNYSVSRAAHEEEIGIVSVVACCATRNIMKKMIKSFKHKGLKKFFETGSVAGIRPAHRQKLRMRLIALDTASIIDDMNLPGFRLHALKGDRQGQWAIDVSRNWRVTFEFFDGDAYIVNYEDYH